MRISDEELNAKINKIGKYMSMHEQNDNTILNLESRLRKRIQNLKVNGVNREVLQETVSVYEVVRGCADRIRAFQRNADAIKQEVKNREQSKKLDAKLAESLCGPKVNASCLNYNKDSYGEESCAVKMDMTYCGLNCPYATNRPCSNVVDGRGRVVNKRKSLW